MKKGDDAFNARDFDGMNAVHDPDMVAYIAGSAEPIVGREAHAAAMGHMLRAFPDMHVYNDPYDVQYGEGLDHRDHPHHRNLHRRNGTSRRHRDPAHR
jgi:hypothetical protein